VRIRKDAENLREGAMAVNERQAVWEGETHSPRQACSRIESCVTKPTRPLAAPVRATASTGGAGGCIVGMV
jgi:hypothetical protein